MNHKTPDWLRVLVLSRDGFLCHYCGLPAGTVDHVLPRAQGGMDTADNLVAACMTCNRRKGARTIPPPARIAMPHE